MKKLLLLAVVATMALGVSAKEPAKGQEQIRKDKIIMKAPAVDQSASAKFERDAKKRPLELRRMPNGKIKLMPKGQDKPVLRR